VVQLVHRTSAKGLSGSHLNSGMVSIQRTQQACCWSKHHSYTSAESGASADASAGTEQLEAVSRIHL
jgi:hypothetical protein